MWKDRRCFQRIELVQLDGIFLVKRMFPILAPSIEIDRDDRKYNDVEKVTADKMKCMRRADSRRCYPSINTEHSECVL